MVTTDKCEIIAFIRFINLRLNSNRVPFRLSVPFVGLHLGCIYSWTYGYTVAYVEYIIKNPEYSTVYSFYIFVLTYTLFSPVEGAESRHTVAKCMPKGQPLGIQLAKKSLGGISVDFATCTLSKTQTCC